MSQSEIAQAITRSRHYLNDRPEKACSRDSKATAVLEEGLRVRVEGPHGWSLVTDMAPGVGGKGSAPTPGWMLRSASAACLVSLIAMRAAEEGVDLSLLEVEVDSESDNRGLLGLGDDIPAGPLGLRTLVRVAAADVDDATLRDIVQWADEHSPVDDAVRRAVPVELVVMTG
ncbi:putative OsmC-like protein [Arthrobacter pascens]|uniref:OsmC family protein n=1 Tax=Arthrobacter pascens TaxID=1677 RepID=UPI002866B23A|nr:OsmC family protein [Arthrobacter pascens]MDR6558821.1 putative OsmC-like protein [Arthrobacter pascens]